MRRVTSLLLLVIFVLLAVTGLVMVFSHGGGSRPPADFASAVQTGERLLAQPRGNSFFPKELHEWMGYAMIGVVVLHVVLNGRLLLQYCGIRERKD
jgi:cytochrome b561